MQYISAQHCIGQLFSNNMASEAMQQFAEQNNIAVEFLLFLAAVDNPARAGDQLGRVALAFKASG